MQRIATLFSLVLAAGLVHAQCTDIAFPSGTMVVTSSGTAALPPGPVWVCSGLDVTIIGDFHLLLVEANSTVQVVGRYNTGYMKGPGTLTSSCDTCSFLIEPTVAFVPMSGELNIAAPCNGMTFDYTNAPTAGCALNTGIAEAAAEMLDITVLPNPAQDRLTVRAGGVVRTIEVYDMLGQRVLSLRPATDGMYDVSALRPGAYAVRVRTDQGTGVARFQKN